jgi:hypothetical protein
MLAGLNQILLELEALQSPVDIADTCLSRNSFAASHALVVPSPCSRSCLVR